MDIDDDSRKDLMDAFVELQEEVESSVLSLINSWDERTVNTLFRAVHNVKGNAGLLGLGIVVEFTHHVEEVVGALRQKRYPFSEPIGETLILAMDRLHDLHQQELYGKKFDYLRIEEFKTLYAGIAEAEPGEVDSIAHQALHILGAGIAEHDVDLFFHEAKNTVPIVKLLDDETTEEKLRSDLGFFQELSLQIDNQVENWDGRSIQLFDWAMRMNKLAGYPVNELQLAAAVYLHDLGMTLLPPELWSQKYSYAPGDHASISRHPDWGYHYLVRIPGWEEAATIIHQHHECVNGSGYPNGLMSDEIHAGAKILAILDAFFFLTNGRVDTSERRLTVRAVSAINTRVDTEFEGMWVQCFNHMVRKELQAGHL